MRRLRPVIVIALAALVASCTIQIGTDQRGELRAGGPEDPGDPTSQGSTTTFEDLETPEVTVMEEEADDPPPPVDDLPYAEIINRSIESLEIYWAEEFPAVYGAEYTPVSQIIPWDPTDLSTLPPCGGQRADPGAYSQNAFYCLPDDFIGWDDRGLFPQLYQEFGDAAVALVLAHEWGHAVQARAEAAGAVLGDLTIALELQADCFAGAWTSHVMSGESDVLRLADDDIDEAVAGYLIFRDPLGTSPDDPQAHGSAFDRVGAFGDGLRNGVAFCDDLDNLRIAPIRLTRDDVETGGDSPLFGDPDDPQDNGIFEIMVPDLEFYWEANAPAILGVSWDQTDDPGWDPVNGVYDPRAVAALDPATENVPCQGHEDEVARNIVYCDAEDYVFTDVRGLAQPLHQEIGDFSIGMLFSNAYGEKALALAGIDADPVTTELAADCLAGAWAGDVYLNTLDQISQTQTPQAPPRDRNIILSAGDLDEGVAGLVAAQGPELTRLDVTAFDRVEAFRTGFFAGVGIDDDPTVCLP
ncbi:MAG: neutral zinc metallopeptidase [Actinomycetota bacterium]|nr:neutral zinc metallopeptidase [Actinomycetota bacterium]